MSINPFDIDPFLITGKGEPWEQASVQYDAAGVMLEIVRRGPQTAGPDANEICSPKPLSEDAILEAALETLYQTCEAQGFPRAEARGSLSLKLFMEGLRDSARFKRENPTELEILWKKAREAQTAKDIPAYQQYCQDWLFLRCKAKIGDVVEVCAWVKPRKIKIETFDISFGSGSDSDWGMLFFTGDWLNAPPRFADRRSIGAPNDSQLYLVN